MHDDGASSAHPATCAFPTRAGASAVKSGATALDGGCCINPRRGHWIASKGGLRERPSHLSRRAHPPRCRWGQLLWYALPRAGCGVSQAALCNSHDEKQKRRHRRPGRSDSARRRSDARIAGHTCLHARAANRVPGRRSRSRSPVLAWSPRDRSHATARRGRIRVGDRQRRPSARGPRAWTRSWRYCFPSVLHRRRSTRDTRAHPRARRLGHPPGRAVGRLPGL